MDVFDMLNLVTHSEKKIKPEEPKKEIKVVYKRKLSKWTREKKNEYSKAWMRRKTERMDCVCGSKNFLVRNLGCHKKTGKHIKFIEIEQ